MLAEITIPGDEAQANLAKTFRTRSKNWFAVIINQVSTIRQNGVKL